MRNSELCIAFVNGSKNNGKTNSMKISYDGSKLYSYGTVIAQKYTNGSIIINDTKYSPTTSKHQFYLRCAIQNGLVVHHTTKHVPMWTTDLKPYID